MEALIRKKELETHDKGFRVKMDDMLYKKVIAWGATNALEQGDMDFLSSQTKEGTTVLHLAIKNGHTSLVEEALKRCPSLIIMRDLNGDNPLHIAARYDNFAAKIVVHSCKKYVEKLSANVTVPWSTKNLRGYTPLHEALRTYNFEVLFDIFNLNAFGWQCLLEDDTETPLHILARYATPISMELYPSIEKLVKAMEWAIYKRDSEGLTPLMRAAQCGNVFVALVIVLHNTQCVELCDSKGRTFLHLLRLKKASKTDSATKHHIFSICKHMIDIFGVHTLIYSRDCDGNTPLHMAIIDQDFDTAYIVLHKYFDSATEPNKGRLLTSIRNDQGKSIADLIHSYPNVTTNLKRLVEQALSKRVLDEKLLMALRTGDEGAVQNRASNNAFDPSNDEVIQQSMDDDMFSYYESGISFINRTLNLSPELIWQRDSNGDSPMHIAARLQTDGSCKFVELSCSIFQTWVDNDDIRKFALGPLMLRNCRGNAFLHEAVRASNYKVLTFVFERLPIVTVETLTASVNDCGETPLHIAARYALYTDENVITSLRKLIKGSKNVVHMKDVEGFTPILRAILSGQLRIACMILDIHPECLETYDDKGRTILHHLRSSVVELVDDSIDILHIYWEQIFNNHPKLNGLRCVQDKNGNTPLHLALKCGDVAAANFLMEKCLTSKDRQELTIINNEGHSIFDLLSSQPHIDDMKLRKNRTFKEMIKATNIDNTVMDEKLYKATMKGEASIFDVSKTDIESGLAKQHEDAYFLSKTLDGSNILHLAIKYSSKDNKQDLEHVEFVNKALDRFPCLMLEQNTAGNNPLHLAARFRGAVSDRVLQFAVKQVIESNSYCTSSALFRKNGEGNLPIHEAIRCCNESAIVKLLEYYNEVIASQVNHRGETPLHVYADCGFYFEVEDVEYDVVKVLITGNNVVPYTRDFEGLTPLLRAAKSGNILALRRILEYCPQSAELCDPYGKNFMHLLHLTGKYTIGEDSSDILFEMLGNNLFKLISQADGQRLVQDCDGNTPLHYAIKTKNFNLAKALSKRCVDSAYNQELRILNYAGETTSNMLASYGVPDEIVSHIKKKKQLTGFLSGRSSYGVRKQNLKDSVYSLFIIAGLLASITFGAAFQVPGGYNGDNGYPVLLRKAAFQVFLLSDTLAMCGSMIVLFSLLWVMFCSNIYDSFKLLDLSMTLLQLSFYATIVAFMSGVYTSTAEDILWLAISVCGLCSFVILISWKFVILNIIKRLRLVRDMYTSTGKLSIEEYKKAHGKHIGVSFDELSTL